MQPRSRVPDQSFFRVRWPPGLRSRWRHRLEGAAAGESVGRGGLRVHQVAGRAARPQVGPSAEHGAAGRLLTDQPRVRTHLWFRVAPSSHPGGSSSATYRSAEMHGCLGAGGGVDVAVTHVEVPPRQHHPGAGGACTRSPDRIEDRRPRGSLRATPCRSGTLANFLPRWPPRRAGPRVGDRIPGTPGPPSPPR